MASVERGYSESFMIMLHSAVVALRENPVLVEVSIGSTGMKLRREPDESKLAFDDHFVDGKQYIIYPS